MLLILLSIVYDLLINSLLDVSSILIDIIPIYYHYDYIESIDSNVKSIHLPDRICNDEEYTIFDFSRFTLLEELEVGSNSFMYVNEFKIDGLNHLKSLKIGMNSFTCVRKNDSFDDRIDNNSRSFHILNCNELKSIEIGIFSFSDYGGGFELRNLPKLSTIKIGEIGSWSRNFYSSSFVVQGIIDMILLMNRSSTFEFH